MGAAITGYKLWVDAGNDFSSDFVLVSSYNGQDTTFTSVAADLLVTGRVYRFRTTATNLVGDSDFSPEVIVGLGGP
jgi:hypothetical protein